MTRWNRRLLFGAVALLVPALAGCEAGLNAPTLEFHQASDGQSSIVDGMSIDNVFVLGPGLNSALPAGGRAGVFMSIYAPKADQLTSVSAPGTASSVKITGGSISLTPNSLVSLDGPTPKIVLNGLTKPLSGGETIQLVLNFAGAGSVTVDAPVEPQAYAFATYSPPAPVPKAKAKTKPKTKAKASATPGASASASATSSASPSATP